MPTDFQGAVALYDSLSLAGLANSAVGYAMGAGQTGLEGYSLSNLAFGYTLSGTESTAANIAKVLANLIKDLKQRGIIRATGTGV